MRVNVLSAENSSVSKLTRKLSMGRAANPKSAECPLISVVSLSPEVTVTAQTPFVTTPAVAHAPRRALLGKNVCVPVCDTSCVIFRRSKRYPIWALIRGVKSYSTSKVLVFISCRRKFEKASVSISGLELFPCCGQVGALKPGPGQVVVLNTLGVVSRVDPKRLVESEVHVPGIRKLLKRNVS